MSDSPLARLWNSVKPPPAVAAAKAPAQRMNPTQKRMIWGALLLALVMVSGWEVYDYIASAPQRAQTVYDQGMANMTPSQYTQAITLFNKAIDIYPQLGVAYLERGNAENMLGQIDAAMADYEKAIDVSNLAAAYTARGRVYLRRGDTKRAEDNFMRSIGVEPSSDAYYQLGQIHSTAGQFAKAIEEYDQAIHILPTGPYIYAARSQARRALGDEAGAIADRNEAFALQQHGRR